MVVPHLRTIVNVPVPIIIYNEVVFGSFAANSLVFTVIYLFNNSVCFFDLILFCPSLAAILGGIPIMEREAPYFVLA